MRKFTFNPVATPGGGTIQTQIPGGSALRVVVMNFSPANLSLSFANGYTAACVSQDRRLFDMRNANSGNIGWTVDSFVGSIFAGLSLVVVEVYEASERIPEVYPSPVPSLAAPNLQLFTDVATAGNQISLPITVVPGKLFYLTQWEYYCDVCTISEQTSITLQNGQLLNQVSTAVGWNIFHTKLAVVERVYSLPTPYVQALPGLGINVVASADGSTPAHQLFIWGYYI
jgi:hypothetical protein